MKLIAYLLYKYYSTGVTRDVPYFSTLCALVMLLGLHIFQLQLLFDIKLLPTSGSKTRGENFAAIGLFLTPFFLIKKADLQNMQYDKSSIKKGNIFLIAYIISSISFLLFLISMKNNDF